jgi:ribosomal protein L29
MKKEEIKKLDKTSLHKELARLRKELFNLKLNVNGGEVKDYSQFKKLRTGIARTLTFLKQREK